VKSGTERQRVSLLFLNCLQREHKSDSNPIKFHAPPIKNHSSSGISSTVGALF